jgi:hypothetical protein
MGPIFFSNRPVVRTTPLSEIALWKRFLAKGDSTWQGRKRRRVDDWRRVSDLLAFKIPCTCSTVLDIHLGIMVLCGHDSSSLVPFCIPYSP